MTDPAIAKEAQKVVEEFQHRTRLTGLGFELEDRAGGALLRIQVGRATDRFYGVANEISASLAESHELRGRITLKQTKRTPWSTSPEARLLLAELATFLTVDRHSFGDDFFSRYIASGTGAEEQIVASANHVVFGRRGAGKSSLLVYAMKRLAPDREFAAWVDMQQHEGQSDHRVAASVLLEVFRQLPTSGEDSERITQRLEQLRDKPDVTRDQITSMIPAMREHVIRALGPSGHAVIFLDDLHVLGRQYQPELLSILYSLSRGNRTSLKISGIERFTRIHDADTRRGLEPPGDGQIVRLDHNLTNPERSLEHITGILDARAKYCGLPSIASLCNKQALSRLVWLSAGVPRDALSIFMQGLSEAAAKGSKSVTITTLNAAASIAAEDKMRSVSVDAAGSRDGALKILEEVKDFCLRQQRKNAFLIEIRNDHSTFETVLALIDLRFLHVLNPAITPGKAGRRFMALLLDYGFYTGMRAAKSVDLFQKEATTPTVRQLRSLPVIQIYK